MATSAPSSPPTALKRCPKCRHEHPPTLSHFAPDLRTKDHLTRFCRPCLDERDHRAAQNHRSVANSLAARSRAAGRRMREQLRKEEVDRLIVAGVISPDEHPILLPADAPVPLIRVHSILLDPLNFPTSYGETFQTLDQIGRQTEEALLRNVNLLGPNRLLTLYEELRILGLPLPKDATPLSVLRRLED